MTRYRLHAYLYLAIVAVVWGVATPVIKFTLSGIGPLPFLTYRFFISAVAALLIIFLSRKSLIKIRHHFWEVLLYSFITTTLALGILFLGLEKTTVLDAALISAIAPLVTALAGVVFLKEHITKREKIGIGIAFSGTLFTVLEPLFNGGVSPSQLAGNLLLLFYIVIMAFSSVLSKKLVQKKVDPLTLTNVSFVVGFVTLVPFTFSQTSPGELLELVGNLAPIYHAGVIYMALLSGTLAYALWLKGLKSIEISEAGLFAYLVPIFAAPLGVLWLGEKITPLFIVGATLVAIGVIIAEYKKSLRIQK